MFGDLPECLMASRGIYQAKLILIYPTAYIVCVDVYKVEVRVDVQLSILLFFLIEHSKHLCDLFDTFLFHGSKVAT